MSGELERFDPSEQSGRIAYEHFHRYAICRECVSGKRVLDIACGAGYGSALLAETAAEVTGIDISSDAIRAAKGRFKSKKLKYLIADCYDLPFEDNCFDVVVANEMIEHVEDHHGLIKEAKRVLVDGGLFLVSTPNRSVYNRYKTPNQFHVSEMELPEFEEKLKKYFQHVEIIGLRMALLSVGFDVEGRRDRSNSPSAQIYSSYLRGNFNSLHDPQMRLEDPEYLQAICSTAPIEVLPQRTSLFYAPDDDLWLDHERIMAWASQLHEEDEVLRTDLRKLQSEADSNRVVSEANQSHLKTLDNAIDALRLGLEQQRQTAAQLSEGQLPVMARLLSRMTDSEVASDATATVDALFALNAQLIEQKARISVLETAEAKAEATELQLREAVADRDRAISKASELEVAISDLKARISTLEGAEAKAEAMELKFQEAIAERDAAKSKSDELGASIVEGNKNLLSLQDRLAQIEVEQKTLQEQRDRARQDGETLRHDLQAARQRVAELEQLSRPATAEDTGQRKQGRQVKVDDRALERFAQLHRRIHAQIADAPHQIANRKQELRSPPRPSLKARLVNSGAPKTAIFDAGWVAAQLANNKRVSLSSYFRGAQFRDVSPHPLFDASEYLRANPDVADAQVNALRHYLEYGWREGRNPHRYFNNDWYLAQNPDVLIAGWINPLDHYLKFGWREGRWPNPVFDPQAYLNKYIDVAEAGIEPLTHYIAYGKGEGREVPVPGISSHWRELADRDAANISLFDYLLGAPSELPIAQAHDASPTPSVAVPAWPPAPLNNYWLPQNLRDYIISGWGEESISLYWYLCSVMEAYRERGDEFSESEACRILIQRLRSTSQARNAKQTSQPEVTIIVPVYNNFLDTLLCLTTIFETTHNRTFDVIVADDGSSDATQTLIPTIGGVVSYLRQPENLGFLGNCNTASDKANGRYLVLLNNDTLVLPDWLDHLLRPFERFDSVGLVGSKLINSDGTLQEAGGIFWDDGSAWNFGRGQDGQDPEFNYLKDVDYCSGASIAVPATVWHEVGGFDPEFSPAYCEDSDLAFRLREHGFRTLYCPHSEVIHHEGRSHGRDLSSGVKAFQAINQLKLTKRWGQKLRDEHYPNAQNILRARDRSRSKHHVLVIDHYVPQWDQDAGSRTMMQFLNALIEEDCAVTFWPDNLYRDPHYTPELQTLGIEVIYGWKYAGKFKEFLRDRVGLFDTVLLSRPHISVKYLDDIRQLSRANLLYYGHDIHFMRMKTQAENGDNSVSQPAIDQMKASELAIWNRCDAVLYPSQEEIEVISKLLNSNVKAMQVPAYSFANQELQAALTQLERRDKTGEPLQLLFVGGFTHRPNVDGITWFCREVAPLLRQDGIEFRLLIAGSKPTTEIWALEGQDIQVLGFVSDEQLLTLYRESDLVIAPLRYGAGVKGKVIEAMARGVPLVTTNVGAQGIDDARRYLFLADTPRGLAEAIEEAMDPRLAKQRARSGIEYVRANYTGEAVKRVFRELLQ